MLRGPREDVGGVSDSVEGATNNGCGRVRSLSRRPIAPPRGYRIERRQRSFGYNPGMRGVLLAGLIASSALVQSGRLGVFTGSDDVGAPPLKGSAEFDATTRQYKITGSGADIVGTREKDRKSTRLNSSHQIISYAVFCLKKK